MTDQERIPILLTREQADWLAEEMRHTATIIRSDLTVDGGRMDEAQRIRAGRSIDYAEDIAAQLRAQTGEGE